jgi:HSP20 family protein
LAPQAKWGLRGKNQAPMEELMKKKKPFADFDRLTNEIEEMFFRFYGGPRMRMMKGGAFQPLADVFISRDAKAIIIKLEIPGIVPSDVRLSLQDKTLTIEGIRYDSQKEGDRIYQQMEIDYGPFKRRVVLPVDIDVESAGAEYRDGFLTIELPVAEKESTAIKVPISIKDRKEES